MCLRCVAAFFLIFRSPIAVAWILTVGGLITLTAISVPSLRATRIAATDLVVTFDDPPVWLALQLPQRAGGNHRPQLPLQTRYPEGQKSRQAGGQLNPLA